MAPRKAAEQPSAEPDEVHEDPAVAAQEKRWQVIKKRAGYCGLCCDVLRDFQGHCSRRPKCKGHKDSRRLTEDEVAKMRAEFDEEQRNPSAAKEKKVAAAKVRQAANWKPPDEPAANAEYKMNFGKHSQPGKQLSVMEVQQADPGYFKACAWRSFEASACLREQPFSWAEWGGGGGGPAFGGS